MNTDELFQSTPPRRRRHAEVGDRFTVCGVSIHASTQEATFFVPAFLASAMLFQSTPPRRRRLAVATRRLEMKSFNPRLHAGGDVSRARLVSLWRVSIHASTQEAT